jgi:hypothetical protein
MKFTIEDLMKLEPCKDGLLWYQTNIKSEVYEEILLQVGDYCWPWATWLFRVLSKEQNQKIAIFCAREVLPIFEAKYPNDFGPRRTIELAEKFNDVVQYQNYYYASSFDSSAYGTAAAYAAATAYATAASCDASYAYAATHVAIETATASMTIQGNAEQFKQRVLDYVKELCDRNKIK